MRTIARDPAATIASLQLGPTQHDEILRNRRVTLSPVMPALDRYTGVLFDALHARTLGPTDREFALSHVYIHSALLGPVRAGDLVPAYRLSHDSRLPGLSLKKHWAAAVSAELARTPGLLLDFRSEGYVALGPVTSRPESYFLRVVSAGADGTVRALNHFNKKAKGELTRSLVQSEIDFESVDEVVAWAASAGWMLTRSGEAELTLQV